MAHAYARPGVYTVGVTATDAVGNVATVTRAVQITAAPGVDADGDGFFRGTNPGQDCDDGNARINPGATDVRGNRVDENCDGRRAPFLIVGATPKTTWSVLGSRLTLVELRIRGWAKGTKAELRCAGKGCKFKKVRVRGKPKRGVVNALKSLKGGTADSARRADVRGPDHAAEADRARVALQAAREQDPVVEAVLPASGSSQAAPLLSGIRHLDGCFSHGRLAAP